MKKNLITSSRESTRVVLPHLFSSDCTNTTTLQSYKTSFFWGGRGLKSYNAFFL